MGEKVKKPRKEQKESLQKVRGRMESGDTSELRQQGGLLVQTGLEPQVFSTLQDKLELGQGYAQMIYRAWGKFVKGSEPLPLENSAEYEALAQFLFHPDVLRQIVIYQNRNLGGTTFVRPPDQIMESVRQELEKQKKDSHVKDIALLIRKMRENEFQIDKDKEFAKELGLTATDIKNIEKDPERRKELVKDISYTVRSKRPDLLASPRALDAFNFLSDPDGIPYIKESLRQLAAYLQQEIEKGSIQLDERSKQFVLNGLIPLLDLPDTIKPHRRVMLRNALWTVQSYGLATVPVVREKITKAIRIAPLKLSREIVTLPGAQKSGEMALQLFDQYLKSFLSGEDGKDAKGGSDIVDPQLIDWLVERKKEAGEFAADESGTDTAGEPDQKTQKSIDRFKKGVANPISNLVGRLYDRKPGQRNPTIAELMKVKEKKKEEKAEEEKRVDQEAQRLETLPSSALTNDTFLNALKQVKLKKREQTSVTKVLGSYRRHAAMLGEIADEDIFHFQTALKNIAHLLNKKETHAVDAKDEYEKLRLFVQRSRTMVQNVRAEHAAIPGQITLGKGGPYSKAMRVFSNAYAELVQLLPQVEASVVDAEAAMKNLEKQHGEIVKPKKEVAEDTKKALDDNPVVALFKDDSRKLLRITFPESMSRDERNPRLKFFINIRDYFFRSLARNTIQSISEELIKETEIEFQEIGTEILKQDSTLFTSREPAARARLQAFRIELLRKLDEFIDALFPKN